MKWCPSSRLPRAGACLLLGLLGLAPLAARAQKPPAAAAGPQVYPYWTSYHVADGLPAEKVFFVAVQGDKVWAATDKGVGLLEGGAWRSFHKADGLAHDAVLGVAPDQETGEVWFATMGGLSHYSAGRFTTYTQFNSGLPNDVVFGLTVENRNVWVATTAGTARFQVDSKRWDVYTPANSPQHEPWGYHVDYDAGKVYAAIWGGGILEFDLATERWKSYLDPDGEMEIDLFRDDGLVHVITTSVSHRQGLLWASTYFGLSRYDGHRWRGYSEKEGGLVSDFVNFVKARGHEAWVCTDRGLSVVDADSDRWVTYRPRYGPLEGERGWVVRQVGADGRLEREQPLEQAPANNFVLGVDFQGEDVWVATSRGLSRGSRRKQP